ncbi:MAG: nitronate monooxygenase [Chloroflexi bacterium]|nr:nitronate monooxygenase [Chloroflexota bacterium]
MARRLRTPLCDMLGVEYPVILAGMALGGTQETAPTPIKLVAAVSNAGGLGVMGYSFHDPDEFDQAIKELRRLTGGRPFGVDFPIPASYAEAGAQSTREIRAILERDYPKHVAFVKGLLREHNLPEVEVADKPPMFSPALQRKQVEVTLDNRVPVFAAALGDPAWVTPLAHAQGTKVIGMAGAVRHAQRHVAADVDIITAQGTEAGGHTGNIATFPLVPQIVDAVKPRPVLAAGGIGSGRQVAAALALGAQGVWVGTAFLVAEENHIPGAHQEQILGASSDQFTLSKFASGKQQRGYRNVVKEAWEKSGLPALPMPLQGTLMEPFSEAAKQAGRFDLMTNAAGQIGGMLTKRRPAREIFMDMVNEAEETIERLQHNIR